MSLLVNTTNADYHADRTRLSSSQLKLLLKSPEQYYKEYILGLKTVEVHDKFTFGTLVHTLVLEPEKMLTDYAVFEGLRRSGAAWEKFQEQNNNKTLITVPQLNAAEELLRNYQQVKTATTILAGGLSEHNILGEVLGVPGKARADKINLDLNYIVDVKTSSAVSDLEVFRQTCDAFMYDLSAAYYCELARQAYGRLFDFYFVVFSKLDKQVKVYKASSNFLSEGTAKYTQALVLYKKCKESGIWAAEQPTQALEIDAEIEEL